MSLTGEAASSISNTGGDESSVVQVPIPPLVNVTHDAREVFEDYRNIIEAKAQKYFPMPVTFQMVPLKMSVVDVNGVQTYLFKVRIPNNRYVNVRIRQSGKTESRDNQVAVEAHASSNLDEEFTKVF